jgi:hypothetical protein
MRFIGHSERNDSRVAGFYFDQKPALKSYADYYKSKNVSLWND